MLTHVISWHFSLSGIKKIIVNNSRMSDNWQLLPIQVQSYSVVFIFFQMETNMVNIHPTCIWDCSLLANAPTECNRLVTWLASNYFCEDHNNIPKCCHDFKCAVKKEPNLSKFTLHCPTNWVLLWTCRPIVVL